MQSSSRVRTSAARYTKGWAADARNARVPSSAPRHARNGSASGYRGQIVPVRRQTEQCHRADQAGVARRAVAAANFAAKTSSQELSGPSRNTIRTSRLSEPPQP